MAAPTKPFPLGAKNASLVAGVYVTFRNFTRGTKDTVEASGGEAHITRTDYEIGDKIAIEIYGKYKYGAIVTATAKGIAHVIGTLTADTTSATVGL